jgi:hypothetical protein
MRLSRTGKGNGKPRSVHMEIGFWMDKKGVIHLATRDRQARDFHIVVRNDPARRSGHPMLYRRLKSYLRAMGAAELA